MLRVWLKQSVTSFKINFYQLLLESAQWREKLDKEEKNSLNPSSTDGDKKPEKAQD